MSHCKQSCAPNKTKRGQFHTFRFAPDAISILRIKAQLFQPCNSISKPSLYFCLHCSYSNCLLQMIDFPLFSFISSSYTTCSEISQDHSEYLPARLFSEVVYMKFSSEHNISLPGSPCPPTESVLQLKPLSQSKGAVSHGDGSSRGPRVRRSHSVPVLRCLLPAPHQCVMPHGPAVFSLSFLFLLGVMME